MPKPSKSAITPKRSQANCVSRNRGTVGRKKATQKVAHHRLSGFLKYADKYMLPFSLAELKAENNEKDPELRKRFEDICAQLSDENHPCRPFSARYYDRDRKPLYSYFGVRWADDKVSTSTYCYFEMLLNAEPDPQNYDHAVRGLV